MPWFKVDDGFAFHRKAIKAGNASLGLWVRAGSWCAQQLTDGHVPDEVVPLLGATTDDAGALVAAGLWELDEGGYRFCGWHDYQPTKADVEDERAKARERQKEWRKNRRNAVTDDVTSPVTNAVTDAVTDGVSNAGSHGGSNSAPSLPFPSRPVVPNGTTNRGAKRATQMPADWHPKDDHLELAHEYGLDPAFELKAFKDRNEAKGGTYKNWDAAFRTWLNQAKTFRGGQPTSAASPASRKHIPAEVPDHIDPNDAAAYAAWVKEATQ